MRNIEWFWNMIHYILYRWIVNVNNFLDYLLPFYWINKIPAVKKHRSKNGISDTNIFFRKMINNPKNGASIMWAGVNIGGIIVLFEISIYFLIDAFTGYNILIKENFEKLQFVIPIFIISIVIPYSVNYLLLFKNNKYLNYFKEFDQLSTKKRIAWGFITLFVVLLAVGSFWCSLMLIHN